MQEQFGRYILLERIAIGGMAEIFKAKAPGLGGFEKVLAIKRLHPRYSQDADFIEMLIDEARITVELAHSNIGQIFDLGKVEDHYYIAMEFIDGRDLYRALKRLRERRMQFPLDAAAYVAMEACAGLDYAHRKRDSRGRPLNIIHRDVSPQNVLLSMDGDVKIVDFGIAKAALRAYETEAGIIKGKFYYMSPEQARGEHLDHRTDIFSLGIVLYEMLTGDLLYKDDDDVTLLSKVRRADIEPPSIVRPDLPTTLERIVMRALSRDREERYPSAQHMQRDLARYLRDAGAVFNKARLGQLMRELYVDNVVEPAADGNRRARNRDDFGADARSVISVAQFHTPEPTAVDDPLDEPSVELDPSLLHSINSEMFELIDDDIELIEDDSMLEYTTEAAFDGQAGRQSLKATTQLPQTSGYDPSPVPIGGSPAGAYDPMAGLDSLDANLFEAEEPTLAFDRNRGRGRIEPRDPLPFTERPTPVPRQVPAPHAEPILRLPGATPRMVQRMPGEPEEATFSRQPTVIVPGDAPQRVAPAPSPRRARARSADTPVGKQSLAARRDRSARRESKPFPLSRERMLQIAIIIAVVIIAGVFTSWIIDDDDPQMTPSATPMAQLNTPSTDPIRAVVGQPTRATAQATAHSIRITSEPSGAEVLLGERVIYQPTPVTVQVPVGESVKITVRRRGFDPYVEQMSVAPDSPTGIRAVLARQTGTVQIDTRPSNAVVTINDTPAGRSPVTVPRIPLDAPVVIRAEADGYTAKQVTRTFNGRTELSEILELEPLPVAPTTSAPVARRAPARRKTPRRKATRRTARAPDPPARRPRTARRTPRRTAPTRDRNDARDSRGSAGAPGKLNVIARPWGSVFINSRLVARETPLIGKELPANRYSVKVCFEGNPDDCQSKRVNIDGGKAVLKFRR
ncbi:MAG: serine/threonine protein kinase [Bradymonadia bacterium]|jgi:serine/threonine protein kinase